MIRRRRNRIGVIHEEGKWIFNDEEIVDYFCKIFHELFTSKQPQILQELDDLIPACITEEENGNLIQILMEEEIKNIVCPRPDGYSGMFFWRY